MTDSIQDSLSEGEIRSDSEDDDHDRLKHFESIYSHNPSIEYIAAETNSSVLSEKSYTAKKSITQNDTTTVEEACTDRTYQLSSCLHSSTTTPTSDQSSDSKDEASISEESTDSENTTISSTVSSASDDDETKEEVEITRVEKSKPNPEMELISREPSPVAKVVVEELMRRQSHELPTTSQKPTSSSTVSSNPSYDQRAGSRSKSRHYNRRSVRSRSPLKSHRHATPQRCRRRFDHSSRPISKSPIRTKAQQELEDARSHRRNRRSPTRSPLRRSSGASNRRLSPIRRRPNRRISPIRKCHSPTDTKSTPTTLHRRSNMSVPNQPQKIYRNPHYVHQPYQQQDVFASSMVHTVAPQVCWTYPALSAESLVSYSSEGDANKTDWSLIWPLLVAQQQQLAAANLLAQYGTMQPNMEEENEDTPEPHD